MRHFETYTDAINRLSNKPKPVEFTVDTHPGVHILKANGDMIIPVSGKVEHSASPAGYDGPSPVVLQICTAYEQGYGHGYDQRGLTNPYRDKSLAQDAWDYGYSEGNRKKLEHELNKQTES